MNSQKYAKHKKSKIIHQRNGSAAIDYMRPATFVNKAKQISQTAIARKPIDFRGIIGDGRGRESPILAKVTDKFLLIYRTYQNMNIPKMKPLKLQAFGLTESSIITILIIL